MNTSVTKTPTGVDLWFENQKLYIRLQDGREIGVPLEWFPRLIQANQEQLSKWRWIGNGTGVHWESLDEDISVAGLLK
ncbi:MAG: DUF2442 domain-containing protein [Bacteroidetes bacterium]|nr:MAG: DUF2442 domain-containing protein [Bacteroidota bacterium]